MYYDKRILDILANDQMIHIKQSKSTFICVSKRLKNSKEVNLKDTPSF